MRSAESFGRNVASSSRETLITELLGSVRLQDIAYLRCELRAPWGLQVACGCSTFYIIVEGSCWLRVGRVAGSIKLSAGDLVVLPRGGTQALGDSRASPIIDTISFWRNESRKPALLRIGRSGRRTSLVCGSMQLGNAATDALLAILPPVLHVKTKRGSHGPRLHTTVAQLLRKLDPCRSGAEAIVARLADIVFMEAVSEYLDQNLDGGRSGWLAAIRDSQIGPALALLHTRYREPWTVVSLARQVAVSRSLFAAKFSRLIGEPPMRFLKRLRLNSAASSLLSANHKLAVVAVEAGYESAASFTKAFKRQLGMSPGEYRRMRPQKTRRPAPLWQSKREV